MNKPYLLLFILTGNLYHLQAKRFDLVGLSNESASIFTTNERRNYMACAAVATGALCGSIARFGEKASLQWQAFFTGLGAALGGAGIYLAADTPHDVYTKAVKKLERSALFLNQLRGDDAMIVQKIKLQLVLEEFPLMDALRYFTSLLNDFNLFVAMMKNQTIVSKMTVAELELYTQFTPVFEEALAILSNAILAIKSHEDFGIESARYTARMAARAASEAARAQQRSADAQWLAAWNIYCRN